MQRSIPILWGLVIVLLILNLALLYALNQIRLSAVETLDKVEATLDGLANETVVYDIKMNQAVPVKADVPFDQTMEVPLNTVIPIDQVLTVPFKTPAGDVMLDVPVKTDFPIDITVPVHLNKTINVETVVQLNTTLPVEIDIARTPLAGYLKQAKLDIANLRNRLALQGGAPTAEEIPVVATAADEARAKAAADSGDSFQSPSGPIEATETVAPASEALATPGVPNGSQPGVPKPAPLAGRTVAQPDLGACVHAYWPVRPGTTWTYNSPTTSYSQRVDNVSGDQVYLSTQYEGRDIRFSLVCDQEGLGGNYLGDMRRLTELGELDFNNPRGVFLPSPNVMEAIGNTWTQEFDVSGTVHARRGSGSVTGSISRGQAVAVYTSTGFEIMGTPLGPREALRIEQKLDIALDVGFDIASQTILANEKVTLTTIYWFAKGIGPVRVHWQGGTIEQKLNLDPSPVNEQFSVPALAEDQLVAVCVLAGGQSPECMWMAGISQADITAPPGSELEIRGFIFPGEVGQYDNASITEASAGQPTASPAEASPTSTKPGKDSDRDRSALLAYVEAVASLGQQISDATQDFAKSALKYRNGELTLDKFRDDFLTFSPKVKAIIKKVGQLSPPVKAEGAHQKLVDGLAKCDRAIDLMDSWFDTRDQGTKEAAVLLVAGCEEDVTAARNELATLAGRD
jgi:hypothetical protein